ncbi:MFS transporter [Propionibacterium australiense]|uniref:Tetracycline resistance protein TetB signature n=2 Tax=Propionibacterium australiense TaxID=119981 RepID=A0A383S391_9ACTN|nr:MFS transporter [Propionibacterium australiense]SYZ32323.1 Tetracycline resistance protein TetB signature [Propionibacterium australiense]VEH90439.1 Antiseptic resistance protein [Propionibacterium australiense]
MNPQQSAQSHVERISVDRRRWWGLAVLTVALLMASMDNTILNIALPTLARELHATNDALQWTVDAYQLTYAGFLLVAGSLVDRWGRKRTFMTGVILFGVCSIAAGLARGAAMLIAARALTGIGAALLTPSTLAEVSVLFRRPAERTTAFAVWSGANGAGAAIGPLLSGALLERFSWSSIFFINVPLAALCVAAGTMLLPRAAPARHEGRIDWSGVLASILGLSLLCWAVISAPGLGAGSPLVIGAFLVSLVVLGLFVWGQTRAGTPLLDLALFKRRTFTVAVAVSGLVTGGGAGALFVLAQYMQYVLAFTPWQSGLAIMPVAACMLAGAVSAPKVLNRIGIKRIVVIGLALVASGFAAMALSGSAMAYSHLVVGACAFGLGAGMLMPAATQAVMDSLPAGSEGEGSATNSALMQVGSALGVAVIGSLLASTYRAGLEGRAVLSGLDEATRETVLSSAGQAFSMALDGMDELLAAMREAFSAGMTLGLGVCAGIVAVAAIAVVVLYPAPAGEPATGPGRS